MEIYEEDAHKNLIHMLQEHHLEMNDYKKHYEGVPIDDYINLLDTFILWTKSDRDYIKFQEERIDFREKIIRKYTENLEKYNEVFGRFLKL